MVVALLIDMAATRERNHTGYVYLVGTFSFAIIALTMAVICFANGDGEAKPLQTSELGLVNYIPSACWLLLGLFLLKTRTIRYFNLETPWILLNPQNDRRASLFGGVALMVAGLSSLALLLLAPDSPIAMAASFLFGLLAVLLLYVYCRHLRHPSS